MIRQICLLFLFLGIPIQQRTPLPTSRAAARVSITGTVVRGGTNEPIGFSFGEVERLSRGSKFSLEVMEHLPCPMWDPANTTFWWNACLPVRIRGVSVTAVETFCLMQCELESIRMTLSMSA